ncbi:flagellar hook protein FlgE [Hansschlegelia zhihuaiae]|uniref:Flagellar hook protein FlgE n=1 Tax=Hansschlegelia zhihuaiae TaxID=405005 RepID=A0A4Q0MGD1_9HYPH|nr:flagellar hook-basal body complex protein [Hansschlegelia zhihuaiae]RXF72621.1 flagellar hook-basal body complex protein [Hansschlegelia zhihuaiae]
MGIYGALTTAVSGLQAQSFALENISGNIANSQTVGYKRTDTSFADLVLGGDMNVRRQVAGSVQAFSRSTNDVQGTLAASSSSTSIGIRGSGFFLVQDQTGEIDGKPTFDSANLYTRRGDFEVDRNGYLVNGAGYFLMGAKLDPATGNAVGSTNEVIQLTKDFMPATATTAIDYRANLASVPQTTNYQAGDPTSWLLDPDITGDVTGARSEEFLASTISGDAVTVYDVKGGAHDVQFRWGKVANEDSSATPAVKDSWALFYMSNNEAGADDVAWTRVDADSSTGGQQNYEFDDKGFLTKPSNGIVTLNDLTIDGANLGAIALNHGTALTQFADTSGSAEVKQLTQDGASSGSITSIEIADGGLVNATYSNGKSRPLYRIPVVSFYAENRLAPVDGGAYAATIASGQPLEDANAEIMGQAIEQSNVDIADEFTKMIVTQQAYSANTRVVSTSDSMMQDALNMIR